MEVWTGGCTLLTGGWWIVIVDNNKKNITTRNRSLLHLSLGTMALNPTAKTAGGLPVNELV